MKKELLTLPILLLCGSEAFAITPSASLGLSLAKGVVTGDQMKGDAQGLLVRSDTWLPPASADSKWQGAFGASFGFLSFKNKAENGYVAIDKTISLNLFSFDATHGYNVLDNWLLGLRVKVGGIESSATDFRRSYQTISFGLISIADFTRNFRGELGYDYYGDHDEEYGGQKSKMGYSQGYIGLSYIFDGVKQS